jgi:hypothetical protein
LWRIGVRHNDDIAGRCDSIAGNAQSSGVRGADCADNVSLFEHGCLRVADAEPRDSARKRAVLPPPRRMNSTIFS